MTPSIVPFHFLMLAIGEVLKIEPDGGFVNAVKIQDYIQNDNAFGVRPPLADCRLALELMEKSGFIKKEALDGYVWKNHITKEYNDE